MTAGGGRKDGERLLRDAIAMLDGHFQLTSGKHSPLYIEKFRLLERPAQTEALCRMIADWARSLSPELIAGPTTGGELQSIPTPGGEGLFSAPAVWRNAGRTWLFVADRAGTAGYVLTRGRLARQWENPAAGTSPVVAGGLLWVYDPGGTLAVYEPTSGKAIAALPAGPGHWSSPIVTAGRVVLPVGDANQHRTDGVLDLYRLPSP